MKIERYHWRHYFGGVAMVLLVAQLLSGIFLTLFYHPQLDAAYASVQYLYKDFSAAAWVRDSHRWIALFLFSAIVVHAVRSLLRGDFLSHKKRTVWLVGCLLLPALLALLVTGFILPWEWKGYWFMEMVPNYLGSIPIVGPAVKATLIEAFTASRNFVAHVVILPAICIVLIDIHAFSKMRRKKRGIPGYLLKQGLITVPFFIAIVVLATLIPMPTADPEVIPMPLEGTHIPAPEWFVLILLVPFMYFKGVMGPVLGLLVPGVLFLALALLPYFFRDRPNGADQQRPSGISSWLVRRAGKAPRAKGGLMAAGLAFLGVSLAVAGLFGPLYAGAHRSPTLGCNSCHNVSMGTRMGIPPEAFKERNILPNLDDSQWMVEHWFYPQVVW
jgi:quinol-cytochrome oxidoreductase complex cytochrome b subunit